MIISIKSVGMQASKKNECTFHHPRQCLCWNGTILSHYACKNARHCIVCNTTSLFMKSGLHNNNHSGSINSKRYTHHHTVAASRAGAHVFDIPPNALLAFSVYFILQHRCRCCRRFASARAHTHTHRTWAQFVLILIILALRCIFNTTLVPGRFRSDRRSGHLFLLLLFFCSCVFPFFFCRGAVCVCAHDRADAMQFPSVTNGPLKMPQWQARNFVQRTTTNENDLHTPGCFCGDAARQWGRRAMRIKVALT